MCWRGSDVSRLDVAYWYDATMHETTLTLPFDASADFHEYTIDVYPDHIDWGVDGKVLHTDSGVPGKTMPSEPGQSVFILRPNPAQFEGAAAADVRWASYTAH